MAALVDADRADTWRQFMDALSQARVPVNITKVELRAAVDAIDTWLDVAATARPATSFNAAIPEPARSSLTARQKAWLMMLIVARRWELTP